MRRYAADMTPLIPLRAMAEADEVYVSAATAWECLHITLGKLRLPANRGGQG